MTPPVGKEKPFQISYFLVPSSGNLGFQKMEIILIITCILLFPCFYKKLRFYLFTIFRGILPPQTREDPLTLADPKLNQLFLNE